MKATSLILIALFFTLIISTIHCQSNYKKQDLCREENIPHYTANKITDTLTIDGKLDEIIWENASRSNRFTDLIQERQPGWTHVQLYCGTIRTCM